MLLLLPTLDDELLVLLLELPPLLELDVEVSSMQVVWRGEVDRRRDVRMVVSGREKGVRGRFMLAVRSFCCGCCGCGLWIVVDIMSNYPRKLTNTGSLMIQYTRTREENTTI